MLIIGGLCAQHGVDVLVDLCQILDRYCHGIGFFFLCGSSIFIRYDYGAGALLIGDEAVRKRPAVLAAGTFRAEVQSIKDGLDTDTVKAIFILCLCVDFSDGSIQQSETGLHLSDIGTVLVREFRRNRPAVEAQLHHREVVGGGARTQRA